jgi:hypothetical protein
VIDPRHLTVHEWTDAVNLLLATQAPTPKLADAAGWQQWAETLIQTPSVALFTPPDPKGYADWRQWAERFVECVSL